MIPRIFLFILFILLPFYINGQTISVNQKAESLDLQQISTVYKDASHGLTLNILLQPNHIVFNPIQHFNTGITYTDYWVKFT